MNIFKDVANFDKQLSLVDPEIDRAVQEQDPRIKVLAETLIKEEYQEVMVAFSDGTTADLMKELADLIYVCVQAMIRLAVARGAYVTKLDIAMQVWKAVHNSNQSKLGPDAEVRADGKLLKSDSYQEADLSFIKEEF